MTKSVLDYPVRFADCEGGEPTLEELIYGYYVRHLTHSEAVALTAKYCQQIKVAEGITKLFFIKNLLKDIMMDCPEGGMTAESILNVAAEKLLVSILRDRTKVETPPPPSPPQASEPKDGPQVMTFHSFKELMDYLNKVTDTPKT